MYRTAFVIAVVFVFLLGCGKTPKANPVEESGMIGLPYSSGNQPGLDWGAVYYVGKRLVVWTDGRGAGAKDTIGPDGTTGTGQVESFDGDSLEFTFSLPFDEPGTVTMGGNTYKLSDGMLLLVSFSNDGPRIKQLKRDFTNVTMQGDSLVSSMRDDSDFKEFFGEQAPPRKDEK